MQSHGGCAILLIATVQGGHNTLLTDRALHLRFYSAILMPNGVEAKILLRQSTGDRNSHELEPAEANLTFATDSTLQTDAPPPTPTAAIATSAKGAKSEVTEEKTTLRKAYGDVLRA